jgi:division protein CdvB (Snf7/Vps24/ESCRT-III family)
MNIIFLLLYFKMENPFEKKPIEMVQDKLEDLNTISLRIIEKMDNMLEDLKEIKEHLKKVDDEVIVEKPKSKGWFY